MASDGYMKSAKHPLASCLQTKLRKTKLCSFFEQGTCRFGETCAFAHSLDELKSTPDFRRSRLCEAFKAGHCSDKNCSYAHGLGELRSVNFKATLCHWNETGRCRHGADCRFAHGRKELEPKNKDEDVQSDGEATASTKSHSSTNEPSNDMIAHEKFDNGSMKGIFISRRDTLEAPTRTSLRVAMKRDIAAVPPGFDPLPEPPAVEADGVADDPGAPPGLSMLKGSSEGGKDGEKADEREDGSDNTHDDKDAECNVAEASASGKPTTTSRTPLRLAARPFVSIVPF
eukprot:TRINITY_DN13861_c0_g1_i1.p1 TRINITY_DN13861_c0_g1~~TRINITY_DN13861_c0_g1_i1.p1  ORF type:complete len:286 (-),score=42.73 TRINITY_DN13861_c0_g1_i1:223-1080(-)